MKMKRYGIALAACLMVLGTGANAASPTLIDLENEFVQIGDLIRPAVVNIEIEGPVPEVPSSLEDMFRQRLFGPEGPLPQGITPRQPRPMRATGSGFIYDKQGHIVTNNHVVEEAENITVTLADGAEYSAKVVGLDPQTDLAVIKIDTGRDLPSAQLGNSSDIRVGQFAIAVGNPRGLVGSMSFGHITALGREGLELPSSLRFQHFIQTDAAINLGNSGGPLCNIDGQVIGINTAIVFGADALGFAIPINTALKVIPTLISDGKVTRGYLGISIDDAKTYGEAVMLPDEKGAFVKGVMENSAAERAGLQEYDVVRKVNGQAIESATDLISIVSDMAPGTAAALEVWRAGKPIELQASVGEYDLDNAPTRETTRNVLGLRLRTLTPDIVEQLGVGAGTTGVLVEDVAPSSAADKAGIRAGDVILEVGMKPVKSIEEFKTLMTEFGKPGKTVLLKTLRGANLPDIKALKIPADAIIE